MPEGLAGALSTPGLWMLLVAIVAAGLVRGFAGFGTALIFMPVATRVIETAEAIAIMSITGMGALLVLVPRAWPVAAKAEVATLAVPAILCAPLGVLLLAIVPETPLRWAVAIAAGITLSALVSGWRYGGRVGGGGLVGIGAAAGVLGGSTGLTGPPVILFYLAGPDRAATVRANTILFLGALEFGVIGAILAQGLLTPRAVWLGVVLTVLYMGFTAVGQALFAEGRETLYRRVAYAVIGAAIIAGLPVWDGG